MELSVVVPCLNEELNLVELTERVLGVFDRGALLGELILVDDGSTDGTRQVISRLETRHPGRVRGCFHPENRGIAEAWRTGVRAARGKLTAVMDADLQYQPEDLLRLRRALYESNVDVVQGWRSPVGRLRDRRYTLSRGFNHMLNGTFGMRLRDNKSGFVLCAREVFLDLLDHRGRYYFFQSFIMVAANAKGYSYKEVETLFQPRRQGESFLDTTATVASLKSLVDLGRAAWEYRIARPPHDATSGFVPRSEPAPCPAPPPPALPDDSRRQRVYLRSFELTHFMMTSAVEQKLRTLRSTEALPRERLRELRDEKVRRAIRHAYRNVPFYRARMQSLGIRPEDVDGQDALVRLPVTTRDDVRRHLYFDIMSEDHDKEHVLEIRGSGAGREPFTCYADRAQLEFRWAAAARARAWTGHRFGEPWVRLGHRPERANVRRRARDELDRLLGGRVFFDVSQLDAARMDALVRDLGRVAPTLVDADCETLLLLASHLQGRLPFRPRAVLSSGQMLSDEDRSRIEHAFGAPVFDQYGSAEFSAIAHECEAHAGHHVVAEGYVVELEREGRPARPGEVGDVIITDLNNTCLPFIRYRIGDQAVAMAPEEPCSCGRSSPRIGAIQGLAPTIWRGADGRPMLASFLSLTMKDLGFAVRRFRVQQPAPGHLKLHLVRAGRWSDDTAPRICAALRERLGESLVVDLEISDDEESSEADSALSLPPPPASTSLR